MVNRAGTLDTRVALQRKVVTQSPSGDTAESWTDLGQRWAKRRPLSGNEINVAAQWVAREQVEFTIRWDPSIADLSPLDRIIVPASDASNSPVPLRSMYDIAQVSMLNRNDSLLVLAIRRSDVP